MHPHHAFARIDFLTREIAPQGKGLKQVSMCELAYDISSVEDEYELSYVQSILRAKDGVTNARISTVLAEPSGVISAREEVMRKRQERRANAAIAGENIRSKLPSLHSLNKILDGKKDRAKAFASTQGGEGNEEIELSFRQCLVRFYDRPFFESPPNPLDPLNEAAQPSTSTWLDRMLNRMEATVNRTKAKVETIDAYVSAVKSKEANEAANADMRRSRAEEKQASGDVPAKETTPPNGDPNAKRDKHRRKRVTTLSADREGDSTSQQQVAVTQQQVAVMMDNHFSALYAAQDEMAANMKTLMAANAHIVNQLTEISGRDSTSAKPVPSSTSAGRLALKKTKEKVRRRSNEEV